MKKKLHNEKRKKKAVIAEQQRVEENTTNVSTVDSTIAGSSRGLDASDPADAPAVDETMVKHLQTTLSMLEERKVSRAEVLALIERMRQRSIASEKEVRYLGGKPKNESG